MLEDTGFENQQEDTNTCMKYEVLEKETLGQGEWVRQHKDELETRIFKGRKSDEGDEEE